MSSATLNGKVRPAGSQTSAWFRWGLTDGYGNTTVAQNVGSGTDLIPFSESITGLDPSTTYHFQAVAENVSGTVFGADELFTTPSSGGGSPELQRCGFSDPDQRVRPAIFEYNDNYFAGCGDCFVAPGTPWDGVFRKTVFPFGACQWEAFQAGYLGTTFNGGKTLHFAFLSKTNPPDPWGLTIECDQPFPGDGIVWQGTKDAPGDSDTPVGTYSRIAGCDTRASVTIVAALQP